MKINIFKFLVCLIFLMIATFWALVAHAAEPAPNKIGLYCDGYVVKLTNTGIVRGTISFEAGRWTELYINGAKKQPDDVLLLNPNSLRLAVIGTTYISGVKTLVLRIYKGQQDYNNGFATHNLRCRLLDKDGK